MIKECITYASFFTPHISKLSKDELSYILVDSAIEIYMSNIELAELEWGCLSSHLENEWGYFSKIRLVCKKWKKMVDKYIYRYIYANTIDKKVINIRLCHDKTFITTVKYSDTGQTFGCRINTITPVYVKIYSTFIYGLFKVFINFRMVKKNTKKMQRLTSKACVTIHIKTEFADPFHKSMFSYPKTIKYYWNKKGVPPKLVKSGWKKVIGEHLMKYIVGKLMI